MTRVREDKIEEVDKDNGLEWEEEKLFIEKRGGLWNVIAWARSKTRRDKWNFTLYFIIISNAAYFWMYQIIGGFWSSFVCSGSLFHTSVKIVLVCYMDIKQLHGGQ